MNINEFYGIREKIINLLQQIKKLYQEKCNEKINVSRNSHYPVHAKHTKGKHFRCQT